MKLEDYTNLAFDIFFRIGICKKGERCSVDARCRFYDKGDNMALCGFIKVSKFSSTSFGVTAKIKIGSVRNAFKLPPSEGEFVFDVGGCLGIVSKFIRIVTT